jgi:hypothetical protein
MIMYTNKLRSLKISALFVRNRWSGQIKPKLTPTGDYVYKANFSIGLQITLEVEADRHIKRAKDEFQG